MSRHTQRKRFDTAEMAVEQVAEFEHPRWKVPGVFVSARAVEIDGQFWVYVGQESELIDVAGLDLPGYERVAD